MALPGIALIIPLLGQIFESGQRDTIFGGCRDHDGRAHLVNIHPRLHGQGADLDNACFPLQLPCSVDYFTKIAFKMRAVRRWHQRGDFGHRPAE